MMTPTLKFPTPTELCKLQAKIQFLPFKNFSNLQTSVKMMADGGTNPHVLNDVSLFISPALGDKSLIMVNNTLSLTKCTGILIVSLIGTEHLILLLPCVYAPDHPRNTLSQLAFKKYNHYRSIRTEVLKCVCFIDNI